MQSIAILLMTTIFASTRRHIVGAFSNSRRHLQTAAGVRCTESHVMGTTTTRSCDNILRCNLTPKPPPSRSPLYAFSTSTTAQEQPSTDDTTHEWSEYEQLVRKLYMSNLFNPVKLGLENMDRLHEALGRPMDQVNTMCSANTIYAARHSINQFIDSYQFFTFYIHLPRTAKCISDTHCRIERQGIRGPKNSKCTTNPLQGGIIRFTAHFLVSRTNTNQRHAGVRRTSHHVPE